MKNIKTFEEISVEINDIRYKKDVINGGLIRYSFYLYGYNFLVSIKKNYFGMIDGKYLVYDDSSVYSELEKLADYWELNYETSEMGFDNLNISKLSSLKIIGSVNKVIEDFINEYNPDILAMVHTSQSRYRVHSLFNDKLNIKYYKFIKIENPRYFGSPRTLIYKDKLNDEMVQFKDKFENI